MAVFETSSGHCGLRLDWKVCPLSRASLERLSIGHNSQMDLSCKPEWSMVTIDRRLAVKRPLVFIQVVHISVTLEFTRGDKLTTDEAMLHSSTVLGSQIRSCKGRLRSIGKLCRTTWFQLCFCGTSLLQERERRMFFACGLKDCGLWKHVTLIIPFIEWLVSPNPFLS